MAKTLVRARHAGAVPNATERNEAALERARHRLVHILTSMNDAARKPEKRREVAAKRAALPNTLPTARWSLRDQAEIDANNARGARAAQRLLSEWNVEAVRSLLRKLDVKVAAYLKDDGTVELDPQLITGPTESMFVLALAQARSALHSAGLSLSHRIKRCANPTCRKWFFDDGVRGRRAWCCTPCGSAHRQLGRKENYDARLSSGDFKDRETPCSRPGCAG